MSSWPLRLTLLLACGLLAFAPLLAQDVPDDEKGAPPTIEELLRIIQAQQEQIEKQQEQIESQQEQIDDQDKAIQGMVKRIDEISEAPTERSGDEVALRERIAALEKRDRDEVDNVTAGEFPGSLPVPGTNMAFKVGGFVNFSLVENFDPIGSQDRFITSSIPVEEDEQIQEDSGFSLSVGRSRVNTDWRMKSSLGEFRAFIEGDFQGDSDSFRLRHAFGQYSGLVVGQTWTTFMDPANRPEEIDLEGLNAMVIVRQPLLRWRWKPEKKEGMLYALGIEDPAADIGNGNSLSQIPDVIGRVIRDRGESRSRLHLSVLLRDVQAKSGEFGKQSKFAWGASAGGVVPTKTGGERDNFQLQLTVGRGMGSYINDLASEGGQDGAFNPETGELETYRVGGGFVAFQHWWADDAPVLGKLLRRVRSTISLGLVWVHNEDFQLDSALHRTQRFTINLMWSPLNNIDVGAEFLWGRREDKDGESATAKQLQIGSYFRF